MQKENRLIIQFIPAHLNQGKAQLVINFPVDLIKDLPSLVRGSDTRKVIKFQMKSHVAEENPVEMEYDRDSQGWKFIDGTHRFLGAVSRGNHTVPAVIPFRDFLMVKNLQTTPARIF